MLILLSVIFVGLTVIFLKIISDDDLSIIGVALFGICSFICIIAMLIVGGNLVNGNIIQDKIEMYQSENAEIDSQICEIVEGYKTYEKELLKKYQTKVQMF